MTRNAFRPWHPLPGTGAGQAVRTIVHAILISPCIGPQNLLLESQGEKEATDGFMPRSI